jgi:hypothetical protein
LLACFDLGIKIGINPEQVFTKQKLLQLRRLAIPMATKLTPLKRSEKLEKNEWHPLSWNDFEVNQLAALPGYRTIAGCV